MRRKVAHERGVLLQALNELGDILQPPVAFGAGDALQHQLGRDDFNIADAPVRVGDVRTGQPHSWRQGGSDGGEFLCPEDFVSAVPGERVLAGGGAEFAKLRFKRPDPGLGSVIVTASAGKAG